MVALLGLVQSHSDCDQQRRRAGLSQICKYLSGICPPMLDCNVFQHIENSHTGNNTAAMHTLWKP